ncbi:MAG: tetratricopeptide repeat protein, partial [Clostridia bacterium]|nr:tetratricopeptide repeat protein [Clostridia bacterium]
MKGKSQLRQAREAFEEVEKLGVVHGPINLARAYQVEGELDAATAALQRTARWPADEVPWWTVNWLSAVINRQQGHIKEAADTLRQLLQQEPQGELVRRRFDFRFDYEVNNLFGETLFDLARRYRSPAQRPQRDELLREAVNVFERTLTLDPENVTAHYNLALLYQMLGENELAKAHREAHRRYKPDDNARDYAVAAARARYPWADRAAEAV